MIVSLFHHHFPSVFQGYTGLDGRKGEPGAAGAKVRRAPLSTIAAQFLLALTSSC